MSDLELRFGGNFLCRLATNPDPFDEPRGRLGWTRAYPGEPDLDRHIHFDPAKGYVRSFTQPTQVKVFNTNPNLNGSEGWIAYLDGVNEKLPGFVGRDGLVADPGGERVLPLRMTIAEPARNAPLCSVTFCESSVDAANQVVKYNGDHFVGLLNDAALVDRGKGLHEQWCKSIKERWATMTKELEKASLTPIERATLTARAKECGQGYGPFGEPRPGQLITMVVSADKVDAASGWPMVGLTLNRETSREARIELCFFGFDADALVGSCVGKLTLPLADN